jgi:drug/metabolite transporter (DMT)-like permease
MLALASACWGLSFPVMKTLLLLDSRLIPEGSSWFAIGYALAPRFLIAFLILLPFQLRSAPTLREVQQGACVGLLGVGGLFLQVDGLRFTSASTSAFLTPLYAILIPLWLAWRTQRNPGARIWICCLLVLTGDAVLGRFDWARLRLGRGECETLFSSVFFAAQILCLGDKSFSGNRPVPMTLMVFAFLGGTFGVLACATAPGAASLALPWRSLPWVGLTLILALFCSLGAFLFMDIWQPKVSPTEAGLLYCAEPLFTSLLTLFLPVLLSRWSGVDYANEHATLALLLGGCLVTLANVLVQLKAPEPADS